MTKLVRIALPLSHASDTATLTRLLFANSSFRIPGAL